jgi:Holliday junction resolvase RusA-like endonuclease
LKLEFTVPGHPVGKGRPRVVGGRSPHGITPDNVRIHENWIRQYAIEAKRKVDGFPVTGLDGPLELSVRFYFAFSAVARKEKRVFVPGIPDLDNLVKCAKDGMMLARLFPDDARIARYGTCEKLYGEPERTEISIREISAEEIREAAREQGRPKQDQRELSLSAP